MAHGNHAFDEDEIVNGWLHAALGLSADETPFPWQEDLLNRFRRGKMPPALDIPTGLGKTAVMAIWLVARASGAPLPRRLVYVVDRRAVVDQATAEAERLREWVEADDKAKRALRLTRALAISTLRGQHVDNREWLEDPAAPAIIVGTVDMVGSRLLFEGYGVSRKMRPYHAALLGADTLVVLDEAHLVPPFERLLDAIARDAKVFGWREPVPRFRLLSLSATGRNVDGALELTPADLEHPIVKKRLGALKQLCVRSLDGEVKLAEALADEAWKLTGNGKTRVRCIVFCDKREDAQRALDVIQKRATGDKKAGVQPVDTCTELFVGGRRVYERQEAAQRLAKLGFLAGKRVTPTVPTFLFATSAAEVGVDLDADHMVCDLVAWERMIQRLGRVHRRGEPETHIANIVVLVEPQPEPKKNEREAIENRNQGKELDEREQKLVQAFEARVKKRRSLQAPLQQLPVQNGCRAASPGALRDLKKRATDDPVLRDVLDSATTPNPLRPAPSRALMDAWSMASLENHPGRPAVAPWLRGWVEDDPPQTAVVWRTFLPVRTGASVTRKELEVFFEAAPPHTSELLETETFRVVEWLVDRAMALLSRHSTIASEEVAADSPLRSDEAVAYVLASDGTPRKPNGIFRNPLRLGDLKLPEDKKAAKQRREDLNRLLAEATVVVDARLGGLKQGLLDTSENALPRTVDDGEAWLRESVAGFRVRSLDATESLVPDARWRERLRFAVDVSEDGEARRWLLIEKWRHTAATEEDRSAARPQLLDTHQRWAIKRAIRLGRRLGLTRDYRRMLGIAASLHDEGKRAKRWQRAFNAPPDGPYAKTRGPINYSLLDGYRHEFGSLAQAKQDKHVLALSESHRELLLHLIAAHHGFARPVISTTGCDGAPPSMLQERAQEVAMRFARLQAHWGPWGLAWWEALLRAADQMASRENDARDAGGGEG